MFVTQLFECDVWTGIHSVLNHGIEQLAAPLDVTRDPAQKMPKSPIAMRSEFFHRIRR